MTTKPTSVAQAAAANDARAMLVAMRARIARDIDNPDTPARDIASLSRRLLEIANEIAAIDAAAAKDTDGVAAAAAVPDEPFDGTA